MPDYALSTRNSNSLFARPEQHGELVRARSGRRGTGKLIEVHGDSAIVEYFHSAAKQERIIHHVSELSLTRLFPQTRCYVLRLDSQRWLAGRIGPRDGQEYEVNLPDRESIWLDQRHIYVRCDLEEDQDPTESLVLKCAETAWFHERRAALVKELIRQRAGTRGMVALSAARIELFPHQVEVVRRVLEDPRQRYLLADEVGLGKTIEAGILIRQFLTDVEDEDVLVVVPVMLQEQWRSELHERVDVMEGGRVRIVSPTDLSQVRDASQFGMMVVDEAHHVAACAASDKMEVRALFDECRRLAHAIPRLLLLSATPAANHEAQFLAMLHLLEPQHYRLSDYGSFQSRVASRQVIGQKLLTLTDDAPPFLLRMTVGSLLDLFPEDAHLRTLVNSLLCQMQESPTDASTRAALVRAVRTHLSESYRLHRRMIRNRRIGLSDAVIERSQAVLLTHHDDSDVTSEVEDALEDWRSLASMETVFSASSAATSVSNRLARIFVTFLECADSSPELLIAAVRHRAGIAQEGDLERISTDLTDEVVRDLAEVPRFPEEQQVLERLIRTAQDQSRQQPRLKILVALLGELRDSAGLMEPPKTLVFASSQVAACALAEQLSSVFGRSAVSRHLASMTQAELEADIHCFRHKRDCFVLVCDRSAEEGRNFQFATHLVHFDLPWQPNRLEQRIGRVDRISRVRDLTMHVMINATSGTTVSAAWYDVLRTGLGIFGNSIASLQFYVDAKMPMLCLTAFRGGAHSLREAASTMNADIVEERLRLDEQAAIDEIDAHDTNARTFFEALDRADSREEELKKAVESWLIDVLRFERHLKSETPRVARYTAPRNALVPADILRAHFTRHLDKAGTFHRTSASRNPKLVLHRLGGGLLDSLVRFSAWDDRGRVFAIWRHDSDWPHEEGAEWIGFRFSFVVVPDTTEPRRMLAETRQQYTTSLEAINRRAEALCPPRAETVFVDIAMNEVVDSGLLARLKKPFKKIANGGSDYNLTKQRVHLIDTVIPPEMWEMKCREARHAAEKHMVERAGFQTRHEKLAMEASRRLLTAVEQIATRERLNRSPGAESVDSTELTLERELGLLLVAGIRKPRILVDSVGFIVISGRVPGTAAQPSAS